MSPEYEKKQKDLEIIRDFVIDRTDGPSDLELKSLARLSTKDLQWLAAAIANC